MTKYLLGVGIVLITDTCGTIFLVDAGAKGGKRAARTCTPHTYKTHHLYEEVLFMETKSVISGSLDKYNQFFLSKPPENLLPSESAKYPPHDCSNERPVSMKGKHVRITIYYQMASYSVT